MAGIQTFKKLCDSRNEQMQEGISGRCDPANQETAKKGVEEGRGLVRRWEGLEEPRSRPWCSGMDTLEGELSIHLNVVRWMKGGTKKSGPIFNALK